MRSWPCGARTRAKRPTGPRCRFPTTRRTCAPTNLTAQVVEGGVALSWDAPAEETDSVTAYRILRAVGEGELTVLEEDTGGAGTSYTDATATEAGATYTYQVKALRDGQLSLASNRAQAEIPAGPLAPTNLTARVAEGGVSLSWDAPAEDAGSVTGYSILRAVGEGDLTVLEQDTGNATNSYTDTSATEAGATYAYRVKALRDGELSLASNRAEAEIPAGPLAPTNLIARVVEGGVALTWDAPAEDAGSVTGYSILRGVGEGELTVLEQDTGNATVAYTDSGASEKGTTYAYRVKALRGEATEPGVQPGRGSDSPRPGGPGPQRPHRRVDRRRYFPGLGCTGGQRRIGDRLPGVLGSDRQRRQQVRQPVSAGHRRHGDDLG